MLGLFLSIFNTNIERRDTLNSRSDIDYLFINL